MSIPIFMGLGSIGSTLLSPITGGASALAGAGLHAVGSWVLSGAQAALDEVAHIIGSSTAPQLESSWFSATYWRVAGLATLLTVPFLFAAAVQALLRSDPALLARAVFGQLPLALIGVSLAAPIIMLLLAATDQMCEVVSGAASGGGQKLILQAAGVVTTANAIQSSAFFAFVLGLITVAASLALTLELLVREAAVYVVVLMLPLAFAALVWPARRIWATRMVELLIALILSKFVIVAILSLAGAAYGSAGITDPSGLLTVMSLLLLSTFAPWTLMRLLPFTELAADTAGALRREVPHVTQRSKSMVSGAFQTSGIAMDWVAAVPAVMRRQADAAGQGGSGSRRAPSAEPPNFDGEGVGRPASAGSALAMGGAGSAAGAAGGSTAGAAGGSTASRSGTSDSRDTAGSPPSGTESPDPLRHERLPGMDAIWQAGNGEWPPMVLGPGGWEGPTAYEPPQPPQPPPQPPQPPDANTNTEATGDEPPARPGFRPRLDPPPTLGPGPRFEPASPRELEPPTDPTLPEGEL